MIFELLARVGHLALLVLAPAWLSPEPTAEATAGAIALGVAVVIIPIFFGVVMARRFATLPARVAAALWILAILTLFVAASHYAGDDGPLLGGYYVSAPMVWSALAATAAALAGEYLGVRFKNKRTGAAVAVLAIGIFVFRDASAYVASASQQWTRVLSEDPANERALSFLKKELTEQSRLSPALDRCIAARPGSCWCHATRAELRTQRRDGVGAAKDARAARCEGRPEASSVRASLALGLAQSGDFETAAQHAEAALVDSPEDPRLLYALALARDKQARYDEALELATRASAADVGGDADLLAAAILIRRGDLVEARRRLQTLLERRPDDPDAVYNLALIDDRQGNYNAAREGYLRTLRLRPSARDARFNLAQLTLRQGIAEEAKHHARKFREAWPDDPRATDLALRAGI